jgi:cytoskeletal protein RodZ
MKELGEYLKKTRISNGVSLTETCEDLDFSTSHLENIESGNVRAFKDVYELKESIKIYAKYLGLDPNKVVDEFNGFLFQHTSKISLDDIKAAQKKTDEEKNKINSPYTIEYKEKFNIWPLIYAVAGIILFILIIYIVISNTNKAPERVNELKSKVEKEELIYEFTYKDYCC